jgi:hypothetical protein
VDPASARAAVQHTKRSLAEGGAGGVGTGNDSWTLLTKPYVLKAPEARLLKL